MKISTKGRYGVRILMDLALYAKDAPRLMSEISLSQNISKKYISQLTLKLNNAGLITSFRGAKGGFKLALAPKEISLLNIIEVMEGPVCIVECVNDKTVCTRSDNCSACTVWSCINKKIRKQLANISLKDLIKLEKNKIRHLSN